MFPELEPLVVDESSLHALGRVGGPCDGSPFASADGSDDSSMAAVWPVFGQFIAHDITADRSPVTERADPDRIRNFRSPRVNLECMYGGGPVGSPYLFDRDDPAKLLIAELGGGVGDVPRNSQGIALLGDPRNDVHLFVSQMHVAFLRLHNRLVDRLRTDGVEETSLFDEARRAAMWHYQWLTLGDFLPGLIGESLAEELRSDGPRYFKPGPTPYIPLEFADAAYRYGHSQIRHQYQVNEGFGPVPLFPDLMGFGPVSREHAVDWELFIDVTGGGGAGGVRAQRAKRLDGRLPQALIALPHQITGEDDGSDYTSLAVRDLQRGEAVGLPSGEAVARHLGVEPLTREELALGGVGWDDETPLWLYILREADVRTGGDRLGPVGGRIVGEVLLGIMDADPESFRAVDPGWRPTLPSREAGRFGLVDVLLPVEK
jgi:Animal haem peroxidase